MKKMNLLSRAEMRKVVGGYPPLQGCEVTCYVGGFINDPSLDPRPTYLRLLATDCSAEAQQGACPLSTPIYELCGNCTGAYPQN